MKNKNFFFKNILFFTVVMIVLPIGIIFVWSIINRWVWPDILPAGLSMRGFEELLGDHSKVPFLLFSSIVLSLVAAFISTLFGFMAAKAFCAYEFRGKAFLRFGAMLPVIIPANVFALGIHVSFIKWGLADSILGVLICHIIYSMPYTVSILTSTVENIGEKYEEQAKVLGCKPADCFMKITFPIILPSLLSAAAMGYIISFSQYFLTVLISGGKVKTFSVVMVPFISGGDRTIASAYVMLFLVSSISVFVIFDFFAKKILIRSKI